MRGSPTHQTPCSLIGAVLTSHESHICQLERVWGGVETCLTRLVVVFTMAEVVLRVKRDGSETPAVGRPSICDPQAAQVSPQGRNKVIIPCLKLMPELPEHIFPLESSGWAPLAL